MSPRPDFSHSPPDATGRPHPGALTTNWPRGFRACASFTFDVDGEAGVLGADWEARRRPSLMSHQAYGPEVGVRRILRLLEQHQVRSTFFVPGYVAELHPEPLRAVLEAGHEMAHHGYLHRSPSTLTEEEQVEEMDRGLEALGSLGVRPRGYRAPMWELSERSLVHLAERGFDYDSSLMDDDAPYLLEIGSAEPRSRLVEIPIYWGLDDWEQYGFLPGASEVLPISSPEKVKQMWMAELEAVVEEGGHFVLTCHPFLSGRPSRARVLDALLRRCRELGGVWIAPLNEVADHISATVDSARELRSW
ncbi:MAG TPA: polysaccharide deacetylase [Candidatus Micrarchaeaceae archaeon]|nr:polysaccharide deacetylase [Candidatus Micrarchaeaceae archaeon]